MKRCPSVIFCRPVKLGFFLINLYLLGTFLWPSVAVAVTLQELSPLLKFPHGPVIAGRPLVLKVYFHNEGEFELTTVLPDSLALKIGTAEDTIQIVSVVEVQPTGRVDLPRNGFVGKEYHCVVPEQFQGAVRVALAEVPDTVAVLDLTGPEEIATTALEPANGSAPAEPQRDIYPTLDSLFYLYQPYAPNFSAYLPSYFLSGANPEESRFQLSFKYRLFNPAGTLGRRFPWTRGIYLGYTQTSLWDLKSESIPFKDTSYKPEVFFVSKNSSLRPHWLKGLFLKGGIQHESNGRAEEFSRSTNTLYVEPILIFYNHEAGWGLQLSPRISAYVHNNDETNPNLPDYRGYFAVDLKVGKAQGAVLATQLRFAEEGTSVQTDLTYPISKFLKNNFDLFFHLQYTDSLAESLINYRERVQALRLGFAIVR